MEAVSKIYLKWRYHFKLWRRNLDLKSVNEDACLRSIGKSFHNWAPLYKNFSWDNQFEVVEELICFRYSLNDEHLHCHYIQILISDNQVSHHVMLYTLG